MSLKIENWKLKILQRQLQAGLLPHAYLFSGNDDASRIEAVNYVLTKMLGENFLSSPDFNKISATPISIEEIRLLKSRAYTTPIAGRKNVFLIELLENLSREAAGALLKVLEEPPPSSMILATTSNKEAIPKTIRSRFSALSFYKKNDGKDAVFSLHNKIRNKKNYALINKLERILILKSLWSDPLFNKRLLAEYFNMLAF